MQIDPLTQLTSLLTSLSLRDYYLSPAPDAPTVPGALVSLSTAPATTLLIGPEGGWTEDEIDAFRAAGLRALRLTDTILRIETAAIAAGAIVLTYLEHAAAPSNPALDI